VDRALRVGVDQGLECVGAVFAGGGGEHYIVRGWLRRFMRGGDGGTSQSQGRHGGAQRGQQWNAFPNIHSRSSIGTYHYTPMADAYAELLEQLFWLFVHDCGWALNDISRKVLNARERIGASGAEH
jgi:hypothetical protein